jgi:ABC-2 type transport system permease protein
MSARRTLATALRVLTQLRHDPRTIGLILLVPSVLLVILRYVFNADTVLFHNFAPLMLGIFPFIVMFVVTSVTTLRERTTGTLERLMTLPLAKLDLIVGYALAFSLLALCQAALASAVVVGWLGVSVQGGTAEILIVAVLSGLVGEALGLLCSAFATSEFQAVQFLPAVVFPQLLTCGLFVPRDHMAQLLRWFADIMPLTYVVEAAKQVAVHTGWPSALIKDLGAVALYAIAALVVSALTLRRQS